MIINLVFVLFFSRALIGLSHQLSQPEPLKNKPTLRIWYSGLLGIIELGDTVLMVLFQEAACAICRGQELKEESLPAVFAVHTYIRTYEVMYNANTIDIGPKRGVDTVQQIKFKIGWSNTSSVASASKADSMTCSKGQTVGVKEEENTI